MLGAPLMATKSLKFFVGLLVPGLAAAFWSGGATRSNRAIVWTMLCRHAC